MENEIIYGLTWSGVVCRGISQQEVKKPGNILERETKVECRVEIHGNITYQDMEYINVSLRKIFDNWEGERTYFQQLRMSLLILL